MTIQIGENVGQYRIIAQLGQGGMATVYKAYHPSLDRYVAIKVLHPAFKEDTTFIARFQREARVLAKVEHPNIVPIYDFAQHDGQPYLVMKFVEGETLKARLARGPLKVGEALKVVDAVGAALAYAHKQGILHRDIKPSNVIIAADDQYYLSDFGLARIAQAGESTLSQDTMLGTPNYISPEQATGVRDLDARTDIYSFGVVLYEITVGRVPYSADTPFSVIHDHIYTPLPMPRALNPNVPEAVERVLLKALAKDRNDRYQDAALLVAAFHQAVGDQLTGAITQQRTDDAETVEAPAALPPVISAGPAADSKAGQARSTAQVPSAPTVAVEKEKKEKEVEKGARRKLPKWVWVAIPLALFTCCVCLFLAQTIRQHDLDLTATAAAAVTSVPTPAPTPATVIAPTKTAPTLTPAKHDPIAEAQALVDAKPKDPGAHLALAKAYYEAGRAEDAVREFTTAAELDNYNSGIYMDAVKYLKDDPIAALKVLASGLKHDPDNKDLRSAMNGLLEQAISLDEAEPILLDYVAMFPDNPVTLAALAQYYIVHGQPVKARVRVAVMQRRFPDDPLTHIVVGNYLAAQGDKVGAIKEYEIVANDPAVPNALRIQAQETINKLKGTPTP